MLKILVFGGSGLVGSRFIELNQGKFEFEAPIADEVDLLDVGQIRDRLKIFDGQVVINLAAFTNVDGAEEEKDNQDGLVYKLNTKVPGDLAKLCKEFNKLLIHISTDYVFDGKKDDSPYTEEDTPNPINWYGKTKYLGEKAVSDEGGKYLIVRLSMPFSAYYKEKSDIARTFLKMLKEGNEIKAIIDQKITPILVDDIAYGLAELIEKESVGVYHLVSSSSTTPFDFAKKIAEDFSLNTDLVKQTTFGDYSEETKAERLKNSWLSSEKFQKEFGDNILHSVDGALNIFKQQTEEVVDEAS